MAYIIWIFPCSESEKIRSAGVMRSGGGRGGLLCEKGAAYVAAPDVDNSFSFSLLGTIGCWITNLSFGGY